jgi:hypothetical protein
MPTVSRLRPEVGSCCWISKLMPENGSDDSEPFFLTGWHTQARFWLEWDFRSSTQLCIPTGIDHRKAMICGVEGLAV